MSEHTKKHLIKAHGEGSKLYVTYQRHTYAIPKKIVEMYEVESKKSKKIKKLKLPTEQVEAMFKRMDEKYSEAGVMLKGLRLRENLTQIDFAKKLNITQANLSNMENGRRAIGKEMAKRIARVFQINYRVFL